MTETKSKAWLECSREEKVERMIESAVFCDQQVKGAERKITELEEEIENCKVDAVRYRKQARMIEAGETEDFARP